MRRAARKGKSKMNNNTAKIAVLVSGGGTNLQALIDAAAAGSLTHGRIELVISNKSDAYALQRAERAGIPTRTILRGECSGNEEFEGRIRAALDEFEIDIIVLAGFMSILSADLTNAYPERIINIHPSLIPAFCGKGFYGLHVHEAVLEYGVKVTGATVHFVNEIPDGGRIIMQKAVDVLEGDTPETLQRRVMEQAEWKILPAAVELVAAKTVAARWEQ